MTSAENPTEPVPARMREPRSSRTLHGRATGASAIRDVIHSFRSPIARAYSRVRFAIVRQPFLEEIGQYLPDCGDVLDLGCGFGLFSLFYAMTKPDLQIVAVDLDPGRVAAATTSAEYLELTNVAYEASDVTTWTSERQFDAIYMLDLLHHLPQSRVRGFLATVAGLVRPGGIVIIKDVADRPRYKMLFTLLLDRLLVGMEPIHYWPPDELVTILSGLGFDVAMHRMNDVLPYPHILYVCRRRAS